VFRCFNIMWMGLMGLASFPRNCLRTERDTGMFPPCAWIALSAPIVAAEQSAVKSLEWLRSSGR